MKTAAERELMAHDYVQTCLDAIIRKADVLRMKAATPPQDYHTKQFSGEILTLVEEIKKWM